MIGQEALQQALRAQLSCLKGRNPAYSLRAYADRLGVNSGALSQILNGRRKISHDYALGLVAKLNLEPIETQSLKTLLELEYNRTKPSTGETRELELRSDQFNAIADGIHFSILSLMETANFKSDPEWIGKRLGESVSRVKLALVRLERLALIKKERQGWKLTTAHLQTSDGIADSAIRHFHEDRLDEAKEKLHGVRVEDRDFFASTLAIQRSRLPAARQLIREFKKSMELLLEVEEKDEVYRLCIQLFPVTVLDDPASIISKKSGSEKVL